MGAVITPYRVCNRCEDFNVGYNTITNAAGKMFPSFAACFVPVDGSTSYKLKDLKVVGMQAMLGDLIQTLNPATTEQNGQYCYYSAEEAAQYPGTESYIGWWKGGWGMEPADDVEIPVGTAFLGNITFSSEAIDLQSSGEAPTYTTKYTTDGSAFPFFGNYIPKDLKLKDIVVTGMQAMLGDLIQTLDPETSDQNGQYCYYSAEEAAQYPGTESYIGWWKGGWGQEPAGETLIPAGTAFLGNITFTSDPIEIKFPSVLKEEE